MRCDLLVLGTEPEGRWAARDAAANGARVCIIERPDDFRLGTIQSRGVHLFKTLQAAVRNSTASLFAPRWATRGLPRVDIVALRETVERIERRRNAEFAADCRRLDIARIQADAAFCGPRHVLVDRGGIPELVHAERVVIASGTHPRRPTHVPFDGRQVLDTDSLLDRAELSGPLIVINEGPLGTAYARLLGELGLDVTLIDPQLPISSDAEADRGRLRRLRDDVAGFDRRDDGRIRVALQSGRQLSAATVLYDAGRNGNTDGLHLEAAGIVPDERGCLWCNEQLQTWASAIYGHGEVVGFPVRDTLPQLALSAPA